MMQSMRMRVCSRLPSMSRGVHSMKADATKSFSARKLLLAGNPLLTHGLSAQRLLQWLLI